MKQQTTKGDHGAVTRSREVTYALLEAEVSPEEGEGHGDAEPERQDGHQRAEGHGRRRALAPQDQIHHEEVSKHHTEGQRSEVNWELTQAVMSHVMSFMLLLTDPSTLAGECNSLIAFLNPYCVKSLNEYCSDTHA